MAKIDKYVLAQGSGSHWKSAIERESLLVQEAGFPKTSSEGVEQEWKCSDGSGELFAFGTCIVNEKNALGLEAGALFLVIGPPARNRSRQEVSEACKLFERALFNTGAQKVKE